MTRKEETFKASADTFNEYGYELTKTIKMLWLSAFIAGAEWADNNPSEGIVNLNDIWHDASEEPQGEDWKILCEDANDDHWVTGRRCGYNWEKFVKSQAITRWSYISDLFPKEGDV